VQLDHREKCHFKNEMHPLRLGGLGTVDHDLLGHGQLRLRPALTRVKNVIGVVNNQHLHKVFEAVD
jgi:hypothetical protein